MKRIIPNDIYRGLPCSVVALGCAKEITQKSDVQALYSQELHGNGYLSLAGMNALIRANFDVIKAVQFKQLEIEIETY